MFGVDAGREIICFVPSPSFLESSCLNYPRVGLLNDALFVWYRSSRMGGYWLARFPASKIRSKTRANGMATFVIQQKKGCERKLGRSCRVLIDSTGLEEGEFLIASEKRCLCNVSFEVNIESEVRF